ncbi:MAG: polyamine aminopropyltransferase [Enterobacteriaceae bacterium]
MGNQAVFHESLHHHFGQFFQMDEVVFQHKSEHQDLLIFDNRDLGRVMALDGIIQTTEKDEFIYHEMMAHVPLFAQGNPEKVLIIGGGDGGSLREVCRHHSVKQIVMVEIDPSVVELCRRYLPRHSDGAFDDPRFQLVIDDGVKFVTQCEEKFDLIICDCTDPVGPGAVLFSPTFYQACARALNERGIFIAQNGVCFFQQAEAVSSYHHLTTCFQDVSFYQAAIPTYYGGMMAFAWASHDPSLSQVPLNTLQERFNQAQIPCRYYNPAIHTGSFALPQYLLDALHHG